MRQWAVETAPYRQKERRKDACATLGGSVRRDPLSPDGRTCMAGGLPLQQLQAAVWRGVQHEPEDACCASRNDTYRASSRSCRAYVGRRIIATKWRAGSPVARLQ